MTGGGGGSGVERQTTV